MGKFGNGEKNMRCGKFIRENGEMSKGFSRKEDQHTGWSLTAELDKVVAEKKCLYAGKGQVSKFRAGIEQSMDALARAQS